MKQKIIDLIFEGWSEGDTGVKRMEPPIVNEITDAIIDKVMATGEDALFIEENIFGRHGGDFFLCHYICSIYQINLLCRIRK